MGLYVELMSDNVVVVNKNFLGSFIEGNVVIKSCLV